MSNRNIIIIGVLLAIIAFSGASVISHRSTNTQSGNSTAVEGTSLDLSGRQLTSLPDSVLSQTDLTSLNISNNQLMGLPDGISRLTNLKILNVENNRLISLPSSIGQLKKLQTADFSNNRLASLPSELGNLTRLTYLKLNDYKGSPSDIDALRAKLPNAQIKTQ